MTADPARKKREARRFTEHYTTPADAFERMLHLGVPAMSHATYQFDLAVTHALRELRIRDDADYGIELYSNVHFKAGEFRAVFDWTESASCAAKLGNRTCALLRLRVLLQHIEQTGWQNIGADLNGQDEGSGVARYAYRAALFHEFLHLFWVAFVVQQLRDDGVRRRAVAAASAESKFEPMKELATRLRVNGTAHNDAVKRIASTFAKSDGYARRACRAIGWKG